VGAPWVDPERFAADLNSRGLPGAYFRPALFEPTFHKHSNTACGGCQIHITDRETFRPVEVGVALLEAFRSAATDRFEWRPPPYEYEYTLEPIDILFGSAALREQLTAGRTASEIAATWPDEVAPFLELRASVLLY
jgi:uncharacterized protein YbbC (DUF1343 family)